MIHPLQPIIVAYGGGVNSTALLCGWVEKGFRPVDLILFADTGGERSETYAFINKFSGWLVAHGQPPVTVVRRQRHTGEVLALEEDCLEIKALPSLAYGFKKCSQKFKREPQDKFVNNWPPAKAWWKLSGERVVKLIGFDADEAYRATRSSAAVEDKKYDHRYPLIEWGWGRDECVAAIARAVGGAAPKSSCFFCPAMTTTEIVELSSRHPALMQRALALEANAAPNLSTVKGLGRRFSWTEFLAGRAPEKVPAVDIACDCYDGERD